MTINHLFNLLDEWRQLPAYQLERRADIFFAMYLERILEKVKGIKADLVIPEFPVRVGAVRENVPGLNRSFKIDYLVYSESMQKVYLVELKTEMASLREKQTEYLKAAADIKISGLISGLLKIYKATSPRHKPKYDKLLQKLEHIKWIKRSNHEILNLDCQIAPEIIFIQPVNKNKSPDVISFDDVIGVLSEIDDPVAGRFGESLGRWKG